jgi:hypothetical protein
LSLFGQLSGFASCPVLPVRLFPTATLKRKTVISKHEENHA